MMILFRRQKINRGVGHLAVGLLLLFQVDSFAQIPAEELETWKAKYPENSIVAMKRSEKVAISWVKDNLVVKAEHFQQKFVLNDKKDFERNVSVPSSDFFQVTNLKAQSMVPNGKKYKTSSNDYFSVQDNIGGSIFHDDLVIYTGYYPSMSVGSKTILTYTETIGEPHFFGTYFFDTPGMPTEESVFEVTAPGEIELDVKFFNVDAAKIKFEKITIKTGFLYRWSMSQVPEVKFEESGLAYKFLSPHLVIRIKSVTKNGKAENYLANVDDLHRWYYRFVRDINKESSPELDSIAVALTKNETSDLEKIRKVFYWVQDNIKYIAFEDGLGGFVPRNAKDICAKRFGDCKDMTSIMHQMLSISGVNANMVWIGTRDIPYTYKEAPSPCADNHMILAYKNGEEWMFIDGTSTFNELGMPSGFIQGKEALIHVDSTRFFVVEVPVIPSSETMVTDTVYMELDNGKIIGFGKAEYSGYYKQHINIRLEGLERDEEFGFVSALLRKGNNKFTIDSLKMINKFNRDKPLNIHYRFNLRDYAFSNNDEIFINLHLDKTYLNEYIDAKRTTPMERNFNFRHNWYYELKIPEGYGVSYMPEDASFTNDLFSFKTTYRNMGTYICVEFSYVSECLVIPVDSFTAWNEMIAKMNTVFKKSITLKKKK